jgi:monofunctional glycosyltransferase
METYLNIAPWGAVVGAEKASRYYFQKSAADLTRREAILLAVTLPSPSVRNPANPSPKTLKIAQAVDKRMPILASRSKCVLNVLDGAASEFPRIAPKGDWKPPSGFEITPGP